jgi:hypothetical protein
VYTCVCVCVCGCECVCVYMCVCVCVRVWQGRLLVRLARDDAKASLMLTPRVARHTHHTHMHAPRAQTHTYLKAVEGLGALVEVVAQGARHRLCLVVWVCVCGGGGVLRQ